MTQVRGSEMTKRVVINLTSFLCFICLVTHAANGVFVVDERNIDEKADECSSQDEKILEGRIRNDRRDDQVRTDHDHHKRYD